MMSRLSAKNVIDIFLVTSQINHNPMVQSLYLASVAFIRDNHAAVRSMPQWKYLDSEQVRRQLTPVWPLTHSLALSFQLNILIDAYAQFLRK